MNKSRAANLGAMAMLWLALDQTALAGPLYGTVRVNKAVATGITLIVACPGFANAGHRASATTDQSGSFSMLVATSGRCEMKAQRGAQSGAPFAVFVSNNPLRLDVAIDGALNSVR